MTTSIDSEFTLIERYFNQQRLQRDDVNLAIGDDGALMTLPVGHQLVVSTDTMVLGTHFLASARPEWVGHKALSSNISDIVAMGAKPCWVTLALTLPSIDEEWVAGFCRGFFALAERHNIQLVGGDTTSGPLAITVTIHGSVPAGEAWLRRSAKVGDNLYISHPLGDSKAGLEYVLNPERLAIPMTSSAVPVSIDAQQVSEFQSLLLERHFCRYPPVELVDQLRGKIQCALDISDGLAADVGHVLKASKVGAEIDVDMLPLSTALIAHCYGDKIMAQQMALTSGEEYALCFTAPSDCDLSDLPVYRIGRVIEQPELRLVASGQPVTWQLEGYDHFGE